MHYKMKHILQTQDIEALKIAIDNAIDLSDVTFDKYLNLIDCDDVNLEFARIFLDTGVSIGNFFLNNWFMIEVLSDCKNVEPVLRLIVEHLLDANTSCDSSCKRTLLTYASKIGNVKIVEALIESGASIDHEQINGAISGKQFEITKILIENGGNINRRSSGPEQRPLLLASLIGDSEIVKLLIENGAEINFDDDVGKTPLMYASLSGNFDTSKILLENGAEIDWVNHYGKTALIKAVTIGVDTKKQMVAAQFLIDQGADVNFTNKEGKTALRYASSPEMISFLMEKGANNKEDMYYLLEQAASSGNLQIIKFFLEKGLDMDKCIKSDNGHDAKTALLLAWENDQAEVENYLLDKGVDVQAGTPLSYEMKKRLKKVIEHQDIAGLKKLMAEGLDVTGIILAEVLDTIYSTEKPFHFEFVKMLIDQGANLTAEYDGKLGIVFEQDDFDNPYFSVPSNCLLYAFEFYDKKLIKYLIENGADVNSMIKLSNDRSCSQVEYSIPIVEAYYRADIDLMRFLIDQGVEKVNPSNFCPKIDDSLEATKLLIENGIADVDDFEWAFGEYQNLLLDVVDYPDLDEYFRTDKVTSEYLVELIKLFVQYGADVNRGAIFGILNSEYLFYNQILELFNLFVDNGLDIDLIGEMLLLEVCKESLRGQMSKGKKDHPNDFIDFMSMEKFEAPDWDYQSLPTEEIHLFQLETYIIKKMIELGVNINAKDKIGMSALMLASLANKKNIVKLLLEAGADVRTEIKVGASDLASEDEIKDMIEETRGHDPEKLVHILTDFTLDTPIKYTTHEWRNRIDSKYRNDFSLFLKEATNQVERHKLVLNKLSPNLYKKIDDFIVNTESETGWSSRNGLKEYMDEGQDREPFDFEMPEDSEYSRFSDRIEQFKNEIEIRGNILQDIFIAHKKRLGRQYKIDISDNLANEKFYTDVEYFKYAVDEIFKEIEKYAEENGNYVVNIDLKKPDKEYIELHITHKNSISGRNGKALLERIQNEKGDSVIGQYLKNLCEWYIVAKHKDGDFKIDCFNEKSELVDNAEGFTHIMRFYR